MTHHNNMCFLLAVPTQRTGQYLCVHEGTAIKNVVSGGVGGRFSLREAIVGAWQARG